jgi:hypothetical protein
MQKTHRDGSKSTEPKILCVALGECRVHAAGDNNFGSRSDLFSFSQE